MIGSWTCPSNWGVLYPAVERYADPRSGDGVGELGSR
jgi:hypothetical protein